MSHDLIIRDVRVVRPGVEDVTHADIAVDGGRITAVAPDLGTDAARVEEGRGRLAFPGVVDAHQHWGIYNPLSEDAETESRASRAGRRHHRADLHAHRAVLPEQGRRLRRLLPRGAGRDRGPGATSTTRSTSRR